MFVRYPSLSHRERKLFVQISFMKLTILRFVCGYPQFLLTLTLTKQASFYNKENIFRQG